MCYYPTKVGTMHPYLKFDLTGAMVDAAHEIGVRAPIYITVGWSHEDAAAHPEWRHKIKGGEDLTMGGDFNIEDFDATKPDCHWQTLCFCDGGGYAELQLSDPEDVLNCGIEIKAAPPGKIIKSLMQLSGGEQAFIGVALFFAILKVNPTPFCILDEIEAALDEVNVERLAQYIKRYSDETQFIITTHRRGTMEVADRLYGVTMPESGISKILTLDVADIVNKKGGIWDELN
mgnify:CR=1 FL=1